MTRFRLDTVLSPQEKFARDYNRRNRNDRILRVIGLIGLAAALVTTAALMIGLGNMAALVARVGGAS